MTPCGNTVSCRNVLPQWLSTHAINEFVGFGATRIYGLPAIAIPGSLPEHGGMRNLPPMTVFAVLSGLLPLTSSVNADEFRVMDGLQALYKFQEDGDTVRDTSGRDSAFDLQITTPEAVTRRDGVLVLNGPAEIRSAQPPVALLSAIQTAGAITLEAWVKPASDSQKGPARLLTLSQDSLQRNLTLGQDGNRFDVRLRTTKTSENGLPSLNTPSSTAGPKLTHVIYTRAADGRATIYLNGVATSERQVEGTLRNWNLGFRLALGDELSGGRPWLGELHLVAIYSRPLSATEVQQNFAAGPVGRPSAEILAERARRRAARHFETAVAPVLARNCLECHDAANRAGQLNLATREAALQGGESGPVIVPGQPEASDLWLSVEADAMPHNRPPLRDEDKDILKQWIAEGATWTLTEIDPAVYVHGTTNDVYVQRLTISEYIETVRHTLDVDIEAPARELLPPDLRADGFSNTAYNLNVDLKHVGAYARLAELIVQQMDVEAFVKRFSKRRKFTDKDMEDVILKMGRWVLRGPVSREELFAYRGITTTVASAGGSFPEAMGYVLEAMLQSPRFMYRVEQQRGGGSRLPPTEYELASRLSYILWGGPPDKRLLDAAERGELRSQLADHVERMLNSDRARAHSGRFAEDWLNLSRLNNLAPGRQRFPQWSPALAADMRRETLAYFDDVVWEQERPLSALLNTQVTFTTDRLAAFYGLPQPVARRATAGKVQFTAVRQASASQPVAAERLHRVDLTNVTGRGGLLTQGSLLTVGGDDASMVTRGLLVMHELLRGVVNDPPPCVDTTPVPTSPGRTQRSIAEGRIADEQCGGCHGRFEPLAFGLEKFDGIGRYHDRDEHGNELRDDGQVLIPGDAKAVKYNNTQELMDLLAASHRVSQSFTWKVTQFALGRPLVAEDAAEVDRIHTQAMQDGGTWKATMKAIVSSELVTLTRTAAE